MSAYGKGDGSVSDHDFHLTFQRLGIRRFISYHDYKRQVKVYLAGGETGFKIFDDAEVEKALFSFYDIFKNHNPEKFFYRLDQTPVVDVFLDSGAFSAYTKNAEIDLNEYIDFCHEYKNRLTAYANLDVIGDPDKSVKNFEKMKNAGLDPVPVFHYRSPLTVLDEMVDANEYIALGGLVPISASKEKMRAWLDRCFSCIRDRVKVHGFGVTNIDHLTRYPFYSVDSTSWLSGQKHGHIFIFKNGRLITHDTTKENCSLTGAMFKDFGGAKNWFFRTCQNAKSYQRLETFVTQLWESRGIYHEKNPSCRN